MASVLVQIIDRYGEPIGAPQEIDEHQIEIYRSYGYTINLVDNNSLPTTPEPTQQPAHLSSEVQQIFDGIFEGTIIIPDWFRQNNMNFVKDGLISSEEFLNSYNSLVDTGVITFPFAPAPVSTTCVDVYRVMNVGERAESLGQSPRVYSVRETVDYETLSDYVKVQNLLVRKCGETVPSDQEVFNYYGVTPTPTEEPELELSLWWVTRPSGEVEQLNVTQDFVDTMTARGWSFSKEQPITPTLPENKDISVIFFTGTGGDLKTHFNILEIIVTEAMHSELSSWLFQNYQGTILASRNFSTDKPVTHSLEEIRNLIQQKIADDTPIPTPPTPTPTKGKGFQFPSIVALTTGALALSLLLSGAKK